MTNFIITPETIVAAELIIKLEDPDCGAIATFSGTVRRHNFNRQVIRLHYQSYKTLAVKEGSKILGEAKEQFNIVNALCVHRVGDLNIGETAVWVGVNAGVRLVYRSLRLEANGGRRRSKLCDRFSRGDGDLYSCSPEQNGHSDQPWSEHGEYCRH